MYKVSYFTTNIQIKEEIISNKIIFKTDYKYYSNSDLKTIKDHIRKYGVFIYKPSDFIYDDFGLYIKANDKKIKIQQDKCWNIYKIEQVEILPNSFFD